MSSTSSTTTMPAAGSKDLVRKDGRQPLQMRGRELKLSELSQFDGSCSYAQGLSAVLVALHGPTLAKQEVYDQCVLHVRILHGDAVPNAGGSERLVQQERLRERATIQDAHTLQHVLEEVVTAVFMQEKFPRCVLNIDVLILHDDGSLLAVAVNAVMCALLDAGLPCRTTAAAVCLCAMRPAIATHNNKKKEKEDERTYFLLDPTLAEEQNETLTTTTTTVVGGSNTSQLESSSTVSSNKKEENGSDEAIATGTFILANPASGGGLLGTYVQACTHTSTLNKKKELLSVSNSSSSALSVEELSEMIHLASRSAPLLFDFFRQCNVPLEEANTQAE